MRAFLFALSLVVLVACGDTDSTDRPDNQPNNAVNNDGGGGAIDDSCETSEDCSGDLVCKAVGDLQLCQNDFGFASPCGDDGDCQEGLECIDTVGSGRICNRHCPKNGDPVALCPETGHCWGSGEDGTYCTPEDDPLHGINERCDAADACPNNLICLTNQEGEFTNCAVPCSTVDDCPPRESGLEQACVESSGQMRCLP